MSDNKYILQGEHPVKESDPLKWALWFEKSNRQIALNQIGESSVSTVFLGLDHNLSKEGPPILWETLVFSGEMDGSCERCSGSLEQALAMHREMMKKVLLT